MNNLTTGIDYLLDLNAHHHQSFINLATERRRYKGEHPTEIAALLCMDGRIHLPLMTQTALGIIQTYRNLGGQFNLGWPFFQTTINNWVQYSISRGRRCLVFITYHFSRGDAHRGCRGFNYDTDASRNAAIKLKDQFNRVYDKCAVEAIVCGIETDLDALILHGENGHAIDLAKVKESTKNVDVEGMLRSLYPSIHEQIMRDMMPLVEGNIRHIAEIRASNRPIAESEHKEWVVGVGRGFDWVYALNIAFIVGTQDPDFSVAIETAAILLKDNVDAGRVNPNGIVLMTSADYRDTTGAEHLLAKEKALFLSKCALDIVKAKVPDLMPHLNILTGCTDLNTRKFEVLERLDKVFLARLLTRPAA